MQNIVDEEGAAPSLYTPVGDDGNPGGGSGRADSSIQEYKSQRAGVVKKRLRKDGELLSKGDAILELFKCIHTTVTQDMCADCGADLRQNENGQTSEASVPMVHIMPDLKVSQKLAQKLGHDDTRRLLADRKLVLLVDLDHTVIHTTDDTVPDNIKGIYHFQLRGPHSKWYHTRLRPGTAEFLKRMSQLYELHICTFGKRKYAHKIAQLLDPEGKYFSTRILSRDECFNATSKTDNLKTLFPNGDSMVCIIDDREDVWNMASNLIQVKPYHFFQHTGDINAPPGLSNHELDGEGVDFKEISENITEKISESSSGVRTEDPDRGVNTVSSTSKDDERNEESVDVFDLESDAKDPEISNSSIAAEAPKKPPSDTLKGKTVSEEIMVVIDDRSKEVAKAEVVEEKTPTSNEDVATTSKPSLRVALEGQKQIEIEDTDEYLLYLEGILRSIHKRFYAIYDETTEITDLKVIVPKIRCEVLRGKSLVFSGLVPTEMKLEQSQAYFIAKSLGADVQPNIGKGVTHLVAVDAGTYKVYAAKKESAIKVVNANWLWTCAERWEHVEEKLFPLDQGGKVRSPEHVVNYSERPEISPSSSKQQEGQSRTFRETLNPLLGLTNADIESMNQDYDTFFESDSSSDEGPVNLENPPMDRKVLKRMREDNSNSNRSSNRAIDDLLTRSEDVMIGAQNVMEFDIGLNAEANDNNEKEDDDDEMPRAKFRRGEDLPTDQEIGSDLNSEKDPEDEDDDEWDMMGAALEREYLVPSSEDFDI
ncbi:RNA polymerase II subunit A C-terminal domain phosphatase-like [Drosophila suzukii]|uniref:RNA polymerase II subunit A C-terminal domain phosphatase n=1 Tax=Drosophila suzukii TaxID=28584 RepID=A0ABM4TV58_DROSZ